MDVLREYFDVNEFDYEANKKKLVDNLNFLKAMSVEEHTFYMKWREVQDLKDVVAKSIVVKSKIKKFLSPTQIQKLVTYTNFSSFMFKNKMALAQETNGVVADGHFGEPGHKLWADYIIKHFEIDNWPHPYIFYQYIHDSDLYEFIIFFDISVVPPKWFSS